MNKKGRIGEGIACKYLIEKNFKIVERNYRSPYGEIDIIAARENVLYFIEVKTWDVYPFSEIEYAVDKRKQKRITETSRYYLMNNTKYGDFEYSFDIVFIEYESNIIKHFKGAFMENSFD